MELILLKDVPDVGHKGDVVCVRDGFGRNYLLARDLALAATRANQKFVEEQRVRSEKRREKRKEDAANRAKKLEQLRVVVEARAGEQGKLFGAVTAEDVREALGRQGYEIERKRIHLKEPIRSVGTHVVTVELFTEIKATVAIEVVAKS